MANDTSRPKPPAEKAAPLFASVEQCANRYGVSRATIWRWVSQGNFPSPTKLSAGCTRWDMKAIELHESALTPQASGGEQR
jgi:prophage regulatory protein